MPEQLPSPVSGTGVNAQGEKRKVSILVSGRGSNMRALVEAVRMPGFPAEIVGVVSNRPKAAALDYARAEGLPAIALDHKAYATREAFEEDLHEALQKLETELICNAGFMRLLTPGFVARWYNRQLNIHPSLLPSFKGLHTHQRVLEAGIRITGCTVHFVRDAMDEGPVVAQAAVRVREDDTEETLARRVLQAEHKLYPHALYLVASGLARVEGEQVRFSARVEPETKAELSGKGSVAGDCFSPPLTRDWLHNEFL